MPSRDKPRQNFIITVPCSTSVFSTWLDPTHGVGWLCHYCNYGISLIHILYGYLGYVGTPLLLLLACQGSSSGGFQHYLFALAKESEHMKLRQYNIEQRTCSHSLNKMVYLIAAPEKGP